MRKNGHSWLIADIYLDGAISEVATRRSEFAAIFQERRSSHAPRVIRVRVPKSRSQIDKTAP